MNVDCTQHTISASYDGHLLITGFQDVDVDACFCIVAYGHRYHDYGIADDSLLYCCKTRAVSDGDLVVVMEENVPTLYQYCKDKEITQDGEQRILHDRRRIHAKVLGSFNFFH